jgi:DNA (cytosine-5)-methyltransferase 1
LGVFILKVIDFFCGAGGFSEGFRQAGFDVFWAVDKWAPAVLTHKKNHPECDVYLGDVEEISKLPDEEFHALVPDSEVIIGSPPCVAFSNSNKSGKGDKDLGVRLIEAFIRIVARKKDKENSILKYWILENVPNSKSFIEKAYATNHLGDKLNSASGIYNAAFYGVPSRRKRFFCGNFPAPEEITKTEEDIIYLRDVLDSLGKPIEKQNSIINDPVYGFSMLGSNVTDHHYIHKLARYQWKKAKQLKQDKGYMGKMSFPEAKNRPARTIMATMTSSARESMIFGNGRGSYRTPTIREVASLMSFPIDYRFYGKSVGIKYKLVGNAVAPKLAYAFAKAIVEKENLPIPTNYPLLSFSQNDTDFYNLNGIKIPIKKEKPKRDVARFKYHIPYLIEKTYRVELTNHNSDFERKEFRWDVEIHKSQGITAKVFTPEYSESWIPKEILPDVIQFIENMSTEIVDGNEFQKVFCLVQTIRKKQNLTGPMELLADVRSFLDSLQLDYNKTIEIQENYSLIELPIIISIGYFVLSEIISKTS